MAHATRERVSIIAVLGLSVLAFAVHVASVRPRLWPAGTGITLSGDTIFASLAEPRPVARIRPPDLAETLGTPVGVTRVTRGSTASRAGLEAGAAVAVDVTDTTTSRNDSISTIPSTPEEALRLWRLMYRRGPLAGVTLERSDSGEPVVLDRNPVWRLDPESRSLWMRTHSGALIQMGAFLLGALILVALGSRGSTATLVTLALAAAAIANSGPMYGAELAIPVVGEALLVFGWIVTPLSFPIIGLAILHFPTRAQVLDRHRWIQPAVIALAMPMLAIGLAASAYLIEIDSAAGPLVWFATHGWLFDASFALALAANVAIVIEGIHRYRHLVDPNERRRIQLVVYTGVPGIFAYAIKAGVPLVSSLSGRPMAIAWPLEVALQALVLLPAIALPYVVAVKHVFSPRTVLRQGLQYALARRTLSVVAALPVAALVFSLVSERDRPLGDIILAQPLFYLVSLGLAALGYRYRVEAQRWLDRRFFRAEYDAREILVSLANRVPYETDPAELVSLVLGQIDNALQPESVAMLAGEDPRLEVVAALRAHVAPLPREGGLATLLRWSEEPLEVFLDDERSPAARLPAFDREWIRASAVSLLVPILTGTGENRALVGLMALGRKRSEEPYTTEDRRLLSGIAAQMSVALDLSRLRRRYSTPSAMATTRRLETEFPSEPLPSLMLCPLCRRCFDSRALLAAAAVPHCPDDESALQPVVGVPIVVDGKYRVDALVGRGGMGAVFRARDLRLERDVAIKTVNAELVADRTSRARFQREAQIVARLQHPSIVTIFDYGSLPQGAAFLVMEFVAGEDLRRVLTRQRVLPIARAKLLISGIAEGVEAAHQAGVLHRDLKPENILLPSSGMGPKVLDFGVAKMADPAPGGPTTLTHGATVIGTPAYMAPEQLRGEPLDARADVYSLAVITYELLTGRLPFGTGSFVEIGIKQAEGALEYPGLSPEVTAVLGRALSLNREARPATAAEFARELRLSPS